MIAHIAKLGLLALFIAMLADCRTISNCQNQHIYAVIKDQINNSTKYDSANKSGEIKRMKTLFTSVCKVVSTKKKILLIETKKDNKPTYWGLIYIYDTGKIYKYVQENASVTFSEGYDFMSPTCLFDIVQLLKDDPIKNMDILKSHANIPDMPPLKIYFVDLDNAIGYFYTL